MGVVADHDLLRCGGGGLVVLEGASGSSLGSRRLLHGVADSLARHTEVVQVGHTSLTPESTLGVEKGE